MASSRSASFFLLLALVLVAQVSARDAPEGGETKEEKASVSVPIMASNPSKCEWMPQCSVDKCTERCVRIGLGNERGFCSFHDMQFECCCPIAPPRAATIIPVSSSAKQV